MYKAISMRKVALIIGIIMSACFANAQTNLVPNGDFEEKSDCPYLYLGGLLDWLPCGTPEYFHVCSNSSLLQVPTNTFGYQLPHSGEAYAGIIIYQFWTANQREYVYVKLKDTLSNGCVYYFKVYFSYGEKSSHYTSSISIRFTQSEISCDTKQSVLINPIGQQIDYYNDTISYNTDIWYLFDGVFKSRGNEDYIVIGNFKNDGNTDTVTGNNILYDRAYLYIDNIQLYNLCEDSTLLQGICIKPQLPTGITVNADGKNDKLRLMNPTLFNSLKLNLYDRWGHLLYSTNDVNFAWDGSFQGSRVPIGVYQWQAVYTTIYDNKEQYATGNVTVLY